MILNNQNAKDLDAAYDLWNDAVEAWGTWTEAPESESDESESDEDYDKYALPSN